MTRDLGPLRPIVDGCARLNAWAGELSSLEFADERGWLSADERAHSHDLAARFPAEQAELAARWRELPAAAIAAHEDRVRSILADMRAAGGKLGHFYLESLEARALSTCSPERSFDFWAIWAIYQL